MTMKQKETDIVKEKDIFNNDEDINNDEKDKPKDNEEDIYLDLSNVKFI